MKRTNIVSLTDEIALTAADLSKLGMADAVILATASLAGSEVTTSDADFAGIPGVVYIPKSD